MDKYLLLLETYGRIMVLVVSCIVITDYLGESFIGKVLACFIAFWSLIPAYLLLKMVKEEERLRKK